MTRSWQPKKVGDFLSLEYGKPLPKDQRNPNGLYPVYGANGIKDWSNRFFHDRSTIVVGRKGSAGETNLSTEKFWPLDVTYFVTFNEDEYDMMFIYYLLKKLNLPKLAKGVKPGINRNDVYAIEVCIPPLPEQKRIVAILDEAFEDIATATANAEKNLANARELFESYLNSVFAKNGEGWVEIQVKEIGAVSTGPFGSLLHKSDYNQTGVPLINPTNIINDLIIPDNEKRVDAVALKRLQAYLLKEGDIAIGRRGEIGRCAVVRQPQDGWVCGTGCFFIRPSKKVNSDFLAWLIRSQPYRSQLEASATGATMKNISNKTLSDLLIHVPDPSVQLEAVIQIENLREKVKSLEIIYQQKLNDLAELKQSILQKAFSGELTQKAA